jgi:hypothetical protein
MGSLRGIGLNESGKRVDKGAKKEETGLRTSGSAWVRKEFPLMKPSPSRQLVASSSSTWTAPLLGLLSHLLLPADGSPQPPARGNAGKLSCEQLWLAFLQGLLMPVEQVAASCQSLLWQHLGPFAPLTLSDKAIEHRLLAEGTARLAALLPRSNRGLQARPCLCSALPQHLAVTASQVVALGECPLQRLRWLCADLREDPLGSTRLFACQQAGLFDLPSGHPAPAGRLILAAPSALSALPGLII